MTALYVLGSIAGYFFIGWRLALHFTPLFWSKGRGEWTYDDIAKDSVLAQFILMTLFWPFMLVWIWGIAHVRGVVEAQDPKMLQRRLEERQRRIDQLERELGIGGPR